MRFVRGTRGAVMVVGAFMAIFIVGMLYQMLGIMETAMFQERLQAAADDAAFGAATEHARAMNVVALNNDALTAGIGALMATQLTVDATRACMQSICHPQAQMLFDTATEQHEATMTRLMPILSAATRANDDVLEQLPAIARDRAEDGALRSHGRLIRSIALLPQRPPLRRATTDTLCAFANPRVFDLARLGLALELHHLIQGFPRVERGLPHCPELEGIGPLVTEPADLAVGTEPFQQRIVLVGNAAYLSGLNEGVEMPAELIGRRPSEDTRAWAVPPGWALTDRTLVVAQAEYFCDWDLANDSRDSDPRIREQKTFELRWRARLRRWRYPMERDPSRGFEAYRIFVEDVVLPSCGRGCVGLEEEVLNAFESLH